MYTVAVLSLCLLTTYSLSQRVSDQRNQRTRSLQGCQGAQNLAKELNITIVALSQLNRGVGLEQKASLHYQT